MIKRLVLFGALLAAGVSSAWARPVYDPWYGFWIAPLVYNGTLYGPTNVNIANWHITQWRLPAGARFTVEPGNLSNFTTTSPNYTSQNWLANWRWQAAGSAPAIYHTINGWVDDKRKLPCEMEYDAFFEPNGPVYGKYLNATLVNPNVGTMTSFNISLTASMDSRTVHDRLCASTQEVMLIGIIFGSASAHQTMFWQIILGGDPQSMIEQSYYYFTGPTNYGYSQPVTDLGASFTSVGHPRNYNLSLLTAMRATITNGASKGMDQTLSHWVVNGIYVGSIVWGHMNFSAHYTYPNTTTTP